MWYWKRLSWKKSAPIARGSASVALKYHGKINYQFMSTKPTVARYEPRFRYRTGEVYKPRCGRWLRKILAFFNPRG